MSRALGRRCRPSLGDRGHLYFVGIRGRNVVEVAAKAAKAQINSSVVDSFDSSAQASRELQLVISRGRGAAAGDLQPGLITQPCQGPGATASESVGRSCWRRSGSTTAP